MVGTRDDDRRSFELFQRQRGEGREPKRRDGALRLAASALASRKQPSETNTQIGDVDGTYNVGDNGRS